MKTILINTSKIVCCWESNNKCCIQMDSGKVWVLKPTILLNNNMEINTKQYIRSMANENKLIELPLNPNDGGANNGK